MKETSKAKSLVRFAPHGGSLSMSAVLAINNQASAPLEASLDVLDHRVSLTRRLIGFEENMLIGVLMSIALASELPGTFIPSSVDWSPENNKEHIHVRL